MKERFKKASLTVASACLVAGGLVSVGWAGHHEGSKPSRIISISSPSAENTKKQQARPDELEINGQKYKKVWFLREKPQDSKRIPGRYADSEACAKYGCEPK